MDNSSALILASVQSFTTYQTKEAYLNACFDALFSDSDTKITCYIRLDRSHIVKEIIRMGALSHQDTRLKKLLQRVLGYMITIKDIKDAEDIIRNIFILILNKYEHVRQVSQAKWELKSIADFHDLDKCVEDIVDDSQTIQSIPHGKGSKFKKWIQNIVEEVRANFVDDELNNSIDAHSQQQLAFVENVYYVDNRKMEIESCLINFLSDVALWSNVMMDSFDSKNSTATSSATEAEFKNIKHIVFKNEKRIRVDTFIEKYLSYLFGNFKFALAVDRNKPKVEINADDDEPGAVTEVLQEICEDEIDDISSTKNVVKQKRLDRNVPEEPLQINEEDNEQDSVVEVSQEIWRNKNVDILGPKKVIKQKRCNSSILEKAKPFTSSIPILPNGSTTIGNNNKNTIICRNTCSFDVFFQIYAAFYKDIPQIAAAIDDSQYTFDKFIRESFNLQKMSDLVALRNKALFKLFPNKKTDGEKNTITIDIFMSVNEMLTSLHEQSHVLYSVTTTKTCKKCDYESQTTAKYLPTKMQGAWANVIANLQKYILFDEKTRNVCSECCTKMEVKTEYNDVVVIHTENAYPDDKMYRMRKEKICKVIILHEEEFQLRAAIEYTSAHFIAHILRNNQKWGSYDGVRSAKVQQTPATFHSVVLFYVKTNTPNSS